MLLSEIFELTNYLSNKHQSGEALRINRFNQLIGGLNKDFFKKKIEELEVYRRSGDPPPHEAYFTSKMLREFKHVEVVPVGVDKRINITTDLHYPFAYLRGIIGNIGGRRRNVELVSDEEYDDRWEDSILGDTAHPYATIAGNFVYISWHANINPVEFTYYAFPVTPYLDYYINVNGVMVFLTAGETHNWAAGEIDSTGTVHGAAGHWHSLTVELAYNADLHMEFLWNLLSICGVKLEQQQVAQYAEIMKAEEKAQ